MSRGKFIVIEGIDGSGGNTQARRLQEYFVSQKILSTTISYPDYKRSTGQFIKEYLDRKHDLTPESQLLLYAADIVVDTETIQEALNIGKHVIADRYLTSTIAWQSTKGVPLEKAVKIIKSLDSPKPDLAILLKIDAPTSINRKLKENQGFDRHESNEKLLADVAKTYQKLARKKIFAKKWVVVDARKTREQVFESIKKAVEKCI